MSTVHKFLIGVMWLFAMLMVADAARAERIKEIATIAGVRNNQIVGYGIVVGLDGTGDQTTQTPFTVQGMINMLSRMGVNLPPGQSLQLKNVAAVMVTAELPPFARIGQPLDVTVSSIGNAKSLRGGTLVMTPLKGADGQVYAMAQGNVVVVGAGAAGGGAKTTVNHLAAGRIVNGATVEREVPLSLAQGDSIDFELKRSDFGTAQRVAEAIDQAMGFGVATAIDGRRVQVRLPAAPEARVAFLGRIENLEVTPVELAAKVIVNARTGSVVMNRAVTIEECAVAHGNLSVTIAPQTNVSQPAPLSAGQTVATTNTNIDIKQEERQLIQLKSGANLADVVKALNAVGANPQDLIAILQAMKQSGSLRAELEII
ncbi:MAG: flagellar basal body P-ring protein FlgI [Pseudomonadota bacterium]|nr:flagellar basal body P-ring protein FlgI [Rhodocyclaceae bacterium]